MAGRPPTETETVSGADADPATGTESGTANRSSAEAMADAGLVEATFPLGFQWPTLDPFLFVAHHRDRYPAGDHRLGPSVPLHGRELGSDFSGLDGWSMYHGDVVPGFPQHPHRGFETITYVRAGVIDHSDSMGAAARFGRGDTQWMTAGAGVVHSEMFPLLNADGDNPLELFQIWINLPRVDKMVEPYFTMLWGDRTPRFRRVGDDGKVEVTVIAGTFPGNDGEKLEPLPAPPSSWASRPEADVAVWHLQASGSTTVDLPSARSRATNRVLYVFDGTVPLRLVDPSSAAPDTEVEPGNGAHVIADRPLRLRTAGGEVSCLLLQGRPIGEPVAQYGPFVLNDRAGVVQALEDFQSTGFGGWPWDDQAPVHLASRGRFARHADGRIEELGPIGSDQIGATSD